MKYRLLAFVLILSSSILAGFYAMGKRAEAPRVLVSMSGAHLTLLKQETGLADQTVFEEEVDLRKIPDHLLPEGYEVNWLKEGTRYNAVSAERAVGDKKHRESGLWLFDKQWQPMGQVQGVRGGSWREGESISFAWLRNGETLGVAMHDRSKAKEALSVGVVDVSALQWHEIYRKEGLWGVEYLWLKDELVAFLNTSAPEQTSVVAVDFKARNARTIFIDDQQKFFASPLFIGVASPDKTRVAIDAGTLNLEPNMSSGIWLLDIRNDHFMELTRENQTRYEHSAPRWVNNQELTFHRRDDSQQNGRHNLYRVTLPE